ncbi:MAG: carbohydrate kinase family protein [Rhizobiaceae bacterium]
MTSLAVTGYASVDYAFGLSGQIEGDHTTLIDSRDNDDWPRIGGCPAYVAMAVSAQGQDALPVTWLGNDNHARIYLDSLAKSKIRTDGVARIGQNSPMAILAYQQDGTCACLFDPAFSGEENLTAKQKQVIGAASHLCITVGPPHLMEAVLASRSPSARLYWICKNDAHCFTREIRTSLSAQADVIFCSRSERGMVGETPEHVTIVETQGSKGVTITKGNLQETIGVEPITVRDTTGAGDTFAGGYIAAEMAGISDPAKAAQRGLETVKLLLQTRSAKEIQ